MVDFFYFNRRLFYRSFFQPNLYLIYKDGVGEMEHFDFAKTITNLRKQRGITQEQVANFVGVSKAAVSKWETGLSYPDISLLPKLATFFNLSIDELLGYKPQMTKENIRILYNRLANDFTKKDFEEVFEEINAICDEYYACFPLLMQMANLLLNYYPTAGTNQQQVMNKIFEICERIEEYSNDIKLINQTQSTKAYCYLILKQPEKVLEILGDIEIYTGNDILIASSFQMLGDELKAKETLQVSMFQNIIGILSIASNYLMMDVLNERKFEEIVARIEKVIDAFQLQSLHFNSVLVFYLTAANGFMMQQKEDRALDMIKKYYDVSKKISFPITLHGDEFFDLLDEWILKEIDLGKNAPRDETSIKETIIKSIEENPILLKLHEREEFRMIITNLKYHFGGK